MFRRSHPVAAVLVAAALSHASIPVAFAGPGPEAGPSPEVAASLDDPEALSDAAVEAFHAKDYDGAIALFERAYELDPQPNYKFNIGRVYEEKGDLENAVKYYQEFVKSPGVDISARESASARLKVLREALAAVAEDEEPTPPEIDDGKAELMPTGSAEPVDDGAQQRKRKLRIAGYSLLGVGGVSIVIGAVFGGLAIAKSNEAEDAPLVEDKIAMREDVKTRAAVADAMLITGGVLAAVGLVLVLTTVGKGGKRDRAKRSAFTPSFSPRGAGLSWSARF